MGNITIIGKVNYNEKNCRYCLSENIRILSSFKEKGKLYVKCLTCNKEYS